MFQKLNSDRVYEYINIITIVTPGYYGEFTIVINYFDK